MNPRTVYLLQHAYDYGEEKEHEETKMLGVYSTRQNAEAAMERYAKLPWFSQYPRTCFSIDAYNTNSVK